MTPRTPSRPARRRWPHGLGTVLLAPALLLSVPATAQQQQPAATQPPAQPQPTARGNGGGGGGEPVEIVADSLLVEQENRLATFTGNVDAIQGDLRLRADRLLVYYDRGADDGGGGAAAAGGAAAGPGGQAVRRLEATGNVVVASPGQTARGDRGTYDVPVGQVVLEGNVVLTRSQNVVRGARLDSNLRTGVSTVSAGQPGTSGRPEQRVRALFTPGAAPGAPAAGGGAAAAGKGAGGAAAGAAAAGRKGP